MFKKLYMFFRIIFGLAFISSSNSVFADSQFGSISINGNVVTTSQGSYTDGDVISKTDWTNIYGIYNTPLDSALTTDSSYNTSNGYPYTSLRNYGSLQVRVLTPNNYLNYLSNSTSDATKTGGFGNYSGIVFFLSTELLNKIKNEDSFYYLNYKNLAGVNCSDSTTWSKNLFFVGQTNVDIGSKIKVYINSCYNTHSNSSKKILVGIDNINNFGFTHNNTYSEGGFDSYTFGIYNSYQTLRADLRDFFSFNSEVKLPYGLINRVYSLYTKNSNIIVQFNYFNALGIVKNSIFQGNGNVPIVFNYLNDFTNNLITNFTDATYYGDGNTAQNTIGNTFVQNNQVTNYGNLNNSYFLLNKKIFLYSQYDTSDKFENNVVIANSNEPSSTSPYWYTGNNNYMITMTDGIYSAASFVYNIYKQDSIPSSLTSYPYCSTSTKVGATTQNCTQNNLKKNLTFSGY